MVRALQIGKFDKEQIGGERTLCKYLNQVDSCWYLSAQPRIANRPLHTYAVSVSNLIL